MHDIENCCSYGYICLWLFKYTICSAVFLFFIHNLSLQISEEPKNQDNFTRGGFDGYVAWDDFSGKAIGIQKWEASLPAIENGKIYQVVTLPAGKYNLKINVHEQVNFKKGELYTVVAEGNEMLNTSDVEGEALAFYDMSAAQTGKSYQCCEFTLDKETTVSIGWSVTLAADAKERSMRVSAIHLYKDGKNVSADYLDNYQNIRRKDVSYKRFGIPTYWETKNFYIPQNNSDGTKQGIDQYPGYNTLMMGVWDDASRANGDLKNAMLYRSVTLPAGKYFFGASYEALYKINEGYMFASAELPDIENMKKCIAYSSAKDASADDCFYGITFTLNDETKLYLGWINNFKEGTSTQEFRVKDLTLLRYLDAEYAWKDEEAIMPDNGYLKLSPREWAKIVNGTYNRDSNNEPYLDATSDMEIHLGQIDLSGIDNVEIEMTSSEKLDDGAEYSLFLDGAEDAWTVLKPICTDESFNMYEVKASCPKVDGVHSVKLKLNNSSSNIYSVTFRNSEMGGDDVSVGAVENGMKLKNVDVFNINGILVRKDVNSNDALDGLPKGLYIVNGQKVVKL